MNDLARIMSEYIGYCKSRKNDVGSIVKRTDKGGCGG